MTPLKTPLVTFTPALRFGRWPENPVPSILRAKQNNKKDGDAYINALGERTDLLPLPGIDRAATEYYLLDIVI